MKRLALASFLVTTMGYGVIAFAQDSLVGTYSGGLTYQVPGGSQTQLGVKLTIASVENGAVKGSLHLYSTGPCEGTYPMAGKYADNKLVMRSTAKSGRSGDCSFSFNVTQEGNKFVGTTGGGQPFQFSK